MRITKQIDVDGVVVTVRELTVSEIRQWLADIETITGHDLVNTSLFSDFSFRDFSALTDMSAESIESCTPSQLRSVINAAKEVNADFFGMRDRLATLGRWWIAQRESGSFATQDAQSSEQPASLQ